MKRIFSIALVLLVGGTFLTCAEKARAQNCPTGQPCGVSSAYCDSHTPPSTSGATLISSLPYVISASGNYYLNADLSSTGIGIAVLASNVDINLNGHTLTYGTSPIGSGASQVGEYGILLCNTSNIGSSNEAIDSSYSSNGYCKSGGVSAENVTVENGTITQSASASAYYDPTNCPGSGIQSGCAHAHDSIASHVVAAWYTNGVKVAHVTINFQTVDSYGIRLQYQQSGGSYGLDAECNTLNNSVTQYNRRDEANASIWTGNDNGSANIAKYNTVVGGAQGGILMGVGGKDPQGTTIAYNDVSLSANQGGTSAHMYSNDYSISACMKAGAVSYNYVHSTEGRGIGCVYGADLDGTVIQGNYSDAGEDQVNGEYGSHGGTQGASWVGGCEDEGGKGFEVKDAFAFTLENNTFRTHVGNCGGSAIELAELPCYDGDATCSSTATFPIVIQNNTEVVYNNSGLTTPAVNQPEACFDLQRVEGNYSNYFSTPTSSGDSCTSDGNFAVSESYGPGDYISWYSPSFTIGSNPFSKGCDGPSGSSSFPCGITLDFQGLQSQGIPDELGYVIKDITFGNAATLKFNSGTNYGGGTTQRGVTVEWTYTPTVKNSGGALVSGASVSATDQLGGYNPSCTTNVSGTCSIAVRQETVTEPANGSGLTTNSANPNALTISATGYTALNYPESITATTSELKVFGGVVIVVPPLNLGVIVN